MNDSMYTEIILDLYKNPLNKGTLENPSCSHHKHNSLCGDDMTVTLKIDEDKVTDIMHEGKGCAISQASASLLTDEIKHKSIEAIKKMTKDDVIRLLEIPISPGREKCALLAFECVKGCLKELDNASTRGSSEDNRTSGGTSEASTEDQ